MVTFTGNSIDDTVTYTCNMGFELVNSATATCMQVDMNSAAFSPVSPECRRKLCMNGIEVAAYLNCIYVVERRFLLLCNTPRLINSWTLMYNVGADY